MTREIYEYRKLIDFYIQNNLKENTRSKKQLTQQEIKNYRMMHPLKVAGDWQGGHELYVRGQRS